MNAALPAVGICKRSTASPISRRSWMPVFGLPPPSNTFAALAAVAVETVV